MLVLAPESPGLPPIGLLASSTLWWSHQDSQPGPLLSSSKTLSDTNPPWERGSRQPGPDVSALFTMEKQPLICTEPTFFREGINPCKGPSERPEIFLIKSETRGYWAASQGIIYYPITVAWWLYPTPFSSTVSFSLSILGSLTLLTVHCLFFLSSMNRSAKKIS